jgi:dCTP deaminase
MAFWSGDTLKTQVPLLHIIHPFNLDQVDAAAYVLRMGAEAYITPDYQVKRISDHKKIQLKNEGDDFSIPPGQFAFLLTEETIRIPNHILGFISLRTRYKFKGLINVSGFHVDPGYVGKLVYAVYNAGPRHIYLTRGTQLFLIWFAGLDKSDPDNALNREAMTTINPDLITDISGEILSLQSLSRELKDLKDSWFYLKVYGYGFLSLLSVIGVTFTVVRFWDVIAKLFTG